MTGLPAELTRLALAVATLCVVANFSHAPRLVAWQTVTWAATAALVRVC